MRWIEIAVKIAPRMAPLYRYVRLDGRRELIEKRRRIGKVTQAFLRIRHRTIALRTIAARYLRRADGYGYIYNKFGQPIL